MDVGKFRSSRRRLAGWIIIPPVLALTVVVSTFAWKQYALVELQYTQALSDVLPDVIESGRVAKELVENLGGADSMAVGSENQLISSLQDAANKQNFVIESIQVNQLVDNRDSRFPTLSAQVEGVGDFKSIQLFINDVREALRLLSVDYINLSLPREQKSTKQFEVDIVFSLLLLDGAILGEGGSL